MKKRILAAAMICLLLSGCGQSENLQMKDTEPAAQTEVAETTLDTSFAELPEPYYVAVHYTPDRIDQYDPDTGEKKLLNFTFPWLQITVSGNPQASEKITSYLRNENSKFIKGIMADGDLYQPMGQEQLAQYALEDYGIRGEEFLPYTGERTYHVLRGDKSVLCIMAQDFMYTGGAHGSCVRQYYVFDTATGERLSFGDLTDGPNGLWAAVMENIRYLAETDLSIRDRMDILPEDRYEQVLTSLIREGSWYLKEDSLCLESMEYELGSYAAGMIEFKIPLSQLSDHLKQEYLPAPRDTGRMVLKETSDFLEVDLIQQGEHPVKLSLDAEGLIRDFELFTLVPYGEGEGVHRGEILWAAGEMENCGLGLMADIPELLPNLGIRYRGEDGSLLNFGIFQSGEDGSYFLMELPDLM